MNAALRILWPSFLVACVAELIFFSVFDPVDFQLFGPLGGAIAPPNLVGRVIGVSGHGQILTVELSGLVNNEAKAGWQLALYNEREFKGFVSITHVQGGGAVTCRLVWPAQGSSAPASGDRVSSYNI